jgi:hypothetical protein
MAAVVGTIHNAAFPMFRRRKRPSHNFPFTEIFDCKQNYFAHSQSSFAGPRSIVEPGMSALTGHTALPQRVIPNEPNPISEHHAAK